MKRFILKIIMIWAQRNFRGIPPNLDFEKKLGRVPNRAPADCEASIKDSGFTRTVLGVTVLCLHTATWPGRGTCLAETVWAGSRERFLVLFGNGLTGTVQCRDSLKREQREVPGPVRIDWAVSGTWINWRKVTFNNLLNHNSPYISIILSICLFFLLS